MSFKPFLRIDDQISLHLARPELAGAIFKTVEENRTYLREWLPWVDPTRSEADTLRFIRESMAHNTKGTRLTTFIQFKDAIAGSLGVVQFLRDHKSCEIGYWLREDLQGQGIMTRACKAFINLLFKTRDINRIEIRVATGNTRSLAVPPRLGCKQEGILRQSLYMYDQFYDTVVFGLLKEDWKQPGESGESR